VTGGRAPARKGARWEHDAVVFLAAHGHPYAERTYGAGRPDDIGDIDGLPGWTLQCRNTKALALNALDDAEKQRRGRIGYSAAIIKRPRKPIAQAYVVMSLATFAAIAGNGAK
jgi:hypothetical protein